MNKKTIHTLENILCSGYVSDDNYLILDTLSRKVDEKLTTEDRSILLNMIAEQTKNKIPLRNFRIAEGSQKV